MRGTYPERAYDADRESIPVIIKMHCAGCDESAEIRCETGRYRERVSKWALLHIKCTGKIAP